MRRGSRGVALALALTITACGGGEALDTDITQLTIPELSARMARGELTAEALTDYFLTQIERRDTVLKAVITVNPNALEIARTLDEERRDGELRGPLHGIPILVKDNIETRDMPTTAGSLALADNLTHRDATVVARLKSAGAIILGKTNLSEWANFRSTRSSSGWSAVGGQTRNPHDPSRSPCGSSSGSGAAVAAGFAVAAIGTETDGSIVCPSSVNGVVGVKPTVGVVSRTGIVPISHNQDTAGPMTRSVTDAAVLLNAMQGSDPSDPATAGIQREDYTRGLEAAALEGRRIGVLRSATGYHEGVDALFDAAIERLRAAGAVIVDDLALEPYPDFGDDEYQVLLYDFKHDLNRYLETLPPPNDGLTLKALIAFNREHAAAEMPYFRQEIFIEAAAKGSLHDEAYTSALERIQRAARRDGLDRLIDEHDLDALVAPTVSAAWTIDLINGDHYLGGFSSYPAVAGYPHVTVPMGKLHDLPVGLSFTGAAFSDGALLAYAYAFEQAAPDSSSTTTPR